MHPHQNKLTLLVVVGSPEDEKEGCDLWNLRDVRILARRQRRTDQWEGSASAQTTMCGLSHRSRKFSHGAKQTVRDGTKYRRKWDPPLETKKKISRSLQVKVWWQAVLEHQRVYWARWKKRVAEAGARLPGELRQRESGHGGFGALGGSRKPGPSHQGTS